MAVPKLIVNAPTSAVKASPPLTQVTRTVPPPDVGGSAFGPAATGSVCPVPVAIAVGPNGTDKEHETVCAWAT